MNQYTLRCFRVAARWVHNVPFMIGFRETYLTEQRYSYCPYIYSPELWNRTLDILICLVPDSLSLYDTHYSGTLVGRQGLSVLLPQN